MAIQPRVLRGRQYRRREHTFARGWFQAGAREERLRGRWTGRRAGLPWQRSMELETLGPALDGFGSLGRRRSRGTGREGLRGRPLCHSHSHSHSQGAGFRARAGREPVPRLRCLLGLSPAQLLAQLLPLPVSCAHSAFLAEINCSVDDECTDCQSLL